MNIAYRNIIFSTNELKNEKCEIFGKILTEIFYHNIFISIPMHTLLSI